MPAQYCIRAATRVANGMARFAKGSRLPISATTGLDLLRTVSGYTEFETRDKRFYFRAGWNFSLRCNLKKLDIDFNCIDFGHSNLYEKCAPDECKDMSAIEDKARQESIKCMASHHTLPTYEEAIGLTHMKLGWQAQKHLRQSPYTPTLHL